MPSVRPSLHPSIPIFLVSCTDQMHAQTSLTTSHFKFRLNFSHKNECSDLLPLRSRAEWTLWMCRNTSCPNPDSSLFVHSTNYMKVELLQVASQNIHTKCMDLPMPLCAAGPSCEVQQQQTFKVWQPQRAARSKRPNTPSDGSKHNGYNAAKALQKPLLLNKLSNCIA